MAVRVLVVDDDPGVRTALARALTHEGYEVDTASDGAQALDQAAAADLMVLDLTMPHVGGIEVCRSLRRAGSDLPILVLTARHSVVDRVEGLDAGADDYLVKPFALEELLARLRALTRRLQPAPDPAAERLDLADLGLEPATHQAWRGQRELQLTRTEFALLEVLMRNSGQVLTRAVLYDRVWGYPEPSSSNTLDVYVGYLRRKTEAGGEARLIQTVRGVGFVLRPS